MNYKRQRRIRELPPAIVAILLAAMAFFWAIFAMNSSAAGTTEVGAAETFIPAAETTFLTLTPEPSEADMESSYHTLIKSRDWDADEREMLLKITMAEAEGEPLEGKALVILVVLNRVWSSEFPDTIEDVIFEPGQFTPVEDGGRYWTTEPNEDCRMALRMVEQGWDESEGALYFEACEGESWHSRNLEYLYQVGNHRFYR